MRPHVEGQVADCVVYNLRLAGVVAGRVVVEVLDELLELGVLHVLGELTRHVVNGS